MRILYVDDEPASRRMGALALFRSGYGVETAADGAEAWAALQEIHYHLLITGCDMPRLTGLELALQARRAGMRLPIVLVSESTEALRAANALRTDALRNPTGSWLGVAAHLQKPFAAEVLLETVKQVLRVANVRDGCVSGMVPDFAHIARVQPFPHGGINE